MMMIIIFTIIIAGIRERASEPIWSGLGAKSGRLARLAGPLLSLSRSKLCRLFVT